MIATNRFIEALRERITKERRDEEARLGNGTPPDWAAYRERVGYLRGLAFADGAINKLLQDGE